ncbi:MAG TPA: hypothetical protein PLI62_11185 [Spirochaetota bacterium]|nr:hypothetical protein [Spirochaetota bacterium]HQP49060.1 hypothetical protein [Spirochaetota bacterium]
MKAYKKSVIMKSSGRLTLSGLPFKEGEQLEIILISDENRVELAAEMKSLFKKTQKLTSLKKITESDILNEIREYRSGR